MCLIAKGEMNSRGYGKAANPRTILSIWALRVRVPSSPPVPLLGTLGSRVPSFCPMMTDLFREAGRNRSTGRVFAPDPHVNDYVNDSDKHAPQPVAHLVAFVHSAE